MEAVLRRGTAPLFGQALFQPLAAAAQGGVDCARRGSQAPLQNLQGEADVVLALVVAAQGDFGAVHFGFHIIGDFVVEGFLLRGELVADGFGLPLGK